MLYALSLGLGTDPLDPEQLGFVYEKGLRALPTMGVVLAHPGFWPRDLDSGLDWIKIVHAGQELILHRPLPATAPVLGRSHIAEVIDKGPGKGALIRYQRVIVNEATGELLCTNVQTMFCRGDGGIGGPVVAQPIAHAIPLRGADLVHEQRCSPQAALLYRLNGDLNPLHADPEIARRAGFERPILQGLATMGLAGWGILATVCHYDPAELARLAVRFTAPVFPGETLRTEIWQDLSVISFRVYAVERNVIAIDSGRAELRSTE